MSNSIETAEKTATRRQRTLVPLLPGLGLCAAGVAVSLTVNHFLPTVSALLIAIVLGVLLRNLTPLPAVFEAGLAFSAKKLLRLGVVLLGLQLVIGDILGLGGGVIVVVVAIVLGGIAATLLIGKVMGIGLKQRLLIACGFSICGAAAVAAVDGVVEPEDDEEVVTAIALVVLFGTLMIPIIPLAAGALGLGAHDAGLWAGGSIHEVAQVVAAGGIIGGGALGVAVIVKLARVLMLAPVMAVISAVRRRQSAGTGGKRPPLLPLFVAGFIAMVALRSTGVVPEGVVDAASVVQNALLAAAMFALGAGVKIRNLIKVGPKPFALAACSTLVVAGIALAGVTLVA
ncbi:YeiH family protein [Paramicrobacterium fandaimingii]|uniref:YeiH family protein n=1 Tax=Paramicrobacterium fandaimingii TaxID=2708079 RepID=UPI001423BCC7|nr:putative sulfate exporter family transporter [Microbacterium fandaimingii]